MIKLNEYLSAEQIRALEKAADQHQTESNISFFVNDVRDNILYIQTTQGETTSGKYASEATLIKRTEDVFKKHAGHFALDIYVQTFKPSPASVVTVEWIEQKMLEKGLRIKQIAFDTGIERETISDWVTGKRRMSKIVKALFYFYLS